MPGDSGIELDAFHKAVLKSIGELAAISERLSAEIGSQYGHIFRAQQTILEDDAPTLEGLTTSAIEAAKSVIGASYLWGTKGWDENENIYVEANKIKSGYTYFDKVKC